MRKLLYFCILLYANSCGPGLSDYSEEIAEGYEFANEGEGYNSILVFNHPSVRSLGNLKKYSANDNYICAWQADSTLFASSNFRPQYYKKNTYYKSDRFYIIDIKKEKLDGPYEKDEFFKKAKVLGIKVSWKPQLIN